MSWILRKNLTFHLVHTYVMTYKIQLQSWFIMQLLAFSKSVYFTPPHPLRLFIGLYIKGPQVKISWCMSVPERLLTLMKCCIMWHLIMVFTFCQNTHLGVYYAVWKRLIIDCWKVFKQISEINKRDQIIWASTRENLSSGVCEQHRQTSLHIHAVWSMPLLFSFWKVSYVNLLQMKFQLSS